MKRYKLVALDMDGTVLDDKETISAENKEWIKKALDAGIIVSFATGREIENVLPYTTHLDLQTPLITVNGSEVWENPNQLLNRHLIDAKWVEQFVAIAKEHDLWIWLTSVEGKYGLKSWHPDLLGNQWLKFGFHTEHDHIRHHIYRTFAELDVLEITNSHPHNLEFNPKGINKASALADVCHLLGIHMSEVLAMGDSTNDTAMLRSVGMGVAMGNAQEQVKQIADFVTVTNNENGVAKVIREVVLK